MFSKDALEFLDAFKEKPSTYKVYRTGLKEFLRFYRETGRGETLGDFLDAIEEDIRRPRRQRKRVARNVLKEFVRWLKMKDLKPKSIRTYISAVQSLGGYYGLNISTRYVGLPSSQPVSRKYPWTLAEIGRFIGMIKRLDVKSLAATLFQSGLSLSDVLALTYGDIKREYEKGITPLCLDLTRIKTDTPHMTFIGRLGVSILTEYLETRKRLRSGDPVYAVSRTLSSAERTVELKFQKVARKMIGKYEGRNPMGPHSLRTAFRTLLGDARCPETYIEFFMGHSVGGSDIKKVYVSKSREGWRAEYQKWEPYLAFSLQSWCAS